MKKYFHICFLVIVSLFSSCDHKELCDNHGHMTDVDVLIDWGLSPTASPKTMVAHIFKVDGNHYLRYEFINKEGGSIRVDAGEYRVLCHNGEMATVDEAEGLWDEYYLHCIPQSLLSPMGRDGDAPRPPGTEEQAVVSAPNAVWTATCDHLQVEPFIAGQKMTLRPKEITLDCSIIIDNVENLETGITVSAALSGMSGSYNISQDSHTGKPVTMPINLSSEDENKLKADFKIFGHCPESDGEHILTLYTSDKHYYNFNVTDQMHSVSNPSHLIIKIDHLKLPEPSSGTDIAPSISGWEEVEEIGIDMH